MIEWLMEESERFFLEVADMYAKLYDEQVIYATKNAKSSIYSTQVLKELDSLVLSSKNAGNESNQIREALKKGYVEMSAINLMICRESLHLEYEAEYIVERLVSGG